MSSLNFAIDYPQYVGEIIGMLEESGHRAYIVGGCVRDAILGIPAHDYDVTTSALPEQIIRVFGEKRTVPTGIKQGTVTVLNGEPVEVTTFRIDGSYHDSRHPDSVSFTDDIIKDLSRRDFTVNAMAYNKSEGLIDPFGGREDIERRVIRGVGKAETRFDEDALRILRAFRFSAQLGFEIAPETLSAAEKCRGGLARISRERVGVEFRKLVCSGYPSQPLKLMKKTEIGEFISGDWYAPDETICILEGLSANPEVRLGAFFRGCDTVKATAILKNLKYSNKLISATLQVKNGSEAAKDGDAAEARKFIMRYGRSAVYAAEVACACSQISGDYAKLIADTARAGVCVSLSGLAVNGKDLAALGCRGAEIGRILSLLLGEVIDDPSLNTKSKLTDIAKQNMVSDK